MSLKDVDLEIAFRRLAERRIEEAMREGKFDNLAGMGQPLELEPMPAEENARMTSQTAIENLIAHADARAIKDRARRLGFDLMGITSADPSPRRDYFRRWLDEGQAGAMRYLSNRFEQRTEPREYLPGAKSIICVAINYFVELEPPPGKDTGVEPEPCPPGPPARGKIARYALGDDYHELIKSRLHALADWIRTTWPEVQTRACVDTAPVMEKDLAERAGIGWIGKNTCLINPEIGSWLFLAEIITTKDLPIDPPATDHCGTCTRCIDACPTDAITAPYQLDARKCISYLTIEHREEIPQELEPQIGNWLYGCDICQDVCPHNRKAPAAEDPALAPRFPTGTLGAKDVLSWSEEEYRSRLKNSAMKRIKLSMLQRNARIVLKNQQEEDQP